MNLEITENIESESNGKIVLPRESLGETSR